MAGTGSGIRRAAVAACLAVCLGGCASFLTDREQKVGLATEDNIAEAYGHVLDGAAADYMTALGGTMTPHVKEGYRKAGWAFRLYASEDVVQAFALPGGTVGVTRALARRVRSRDELAAVLAHEMAHVTEQHAYKPSAADVLGTFGATRDQINEWGIIDLELDVEELERFIKEVSSQLGDPEAGFLYEFSVRKEHEADRIGADLAAAAGMNPWAMHALATMLAEVAGSGGAGPKDVRDTHGDPRERIAVIEEHLTTRHASWRERGFRTEGFREEFLDRLGEAVPAATTLAPVPPDGAALLERPHHWCSHCCDASAGIALRTGTTDPRPGQAVPLLRR